MCVCVCAVNMYQFNANWANWVVSRQSIGKLLVLSRFLETSNTTKFGLSKTMMSQLEESIEN